LFWLAIRRSPCNTWICTPGWLSLAVENTSDFLWNGCIGIYQAYYHYHYLIQD
jgi:hypothetical protein